MGYCCTSLCGSGRCSDCCGELVANLCGGTSWWLGGWWEGGRKEKERHEQEQEVKEEEQDQQDPEDKDAESRPEGAVERAHSAWGQAVGVRPHPRTTRRAVTTTAAAAATTHPPSEYTTTSFNEYYILDYYYLSRSCANNCYLILRNWGKTQDILSLLETTPHFSTPSQKKTFSSTSIPQEAAKNLSEDEIRPYSCGILNRNDNTKHILTGSA